MRKDLTQNPETAKAEDGTRQTEIAARAYELWQARGCPEGSPEIDWFRAEHELKDLANATLLAA